jgi:hypothetical protein
MTEVSFGPVCDGFPGLRTQSTAHAPSGGHPPRRLLDGLGETRAEAGALVGLSRSTSSWAGSGASERPENAVAVVGKRHRANVGRKELGEAIID